MTSQITPAQPAAGNWRALYTAALFETDTMKFPERISEAEKAIVARARELFSAGTDTIEEDQALDDALYALRALQSCLNFRSAEPSGATRAANPFSPHPCPHPSEDGRSLLSQDLTSSALGK
jgi:hypothetical protein